MTPGTPVFRKLGKLAPRIDARTLKFENYLDPKALPPEPRGVQWSKWGKAWGMMLNDSLGDCVIAAGGHGTQVLTAAESNGTNEITVPDAAILKGYEDVGGYKPNQPATDNGCVILDFLNYWRNTGLGGYKIGAFVQVNYHDHYQMRLAQALFGGVFLGIQLPLTAQTQIDAGQWWGYVKGAGANGVPGSWGGHGIWAPDFDMAYKVPSMTIITWSALQKLTYPFVDAYTDEAWAILAPFWFNANQVAPNGFNMAALQADLALVAA